MGVSYDGRYRAADESRSAEDHPTREELPCAHSVRLHNGKTKQRKQQEKIMKWGEEREEEVKGEKG